MATINLSPYDTIQLSAGQTYDLVAPEAGPLVPAAYYLNLLNLGPGKITFNEQPNVSLNDPQAAELPSGSSARLLLPQSPKGLHVVADAATKLSTLVVEGEYPSTMKEGCCLFFLAGGEGGGGVNIYKWEHDVNADCHALLNLEKLTGCNNVIEIPWPNRFGIHTNDPDYPLDVAGDIRTTGCLRIGTGLNLLSLCRGPGGELLVNGKPLHEWEHDVDADCHSLLNLKEVTGCNDVIEIRTPTRLGLYTASPQYPLDVHGDIRSTGCIHLGTAPNLLTMCRSATGELTVNGKPVGHEWVQDVDADCHSLLNVKEVTGCNHVIEIPAPNKVGIGTAAPQTGLEVHDVIRSTNAASVATSGRGLEMFWNAGGGGDYTSPGGYIHAIDRSSGDYEPLLLYGKHILLNHPGQGGTIYLGTYAAPLGYLPYAPALDDYSVVIGKAFGANRSWLHLVGYSTAGESTGAISFCNTATGTTEQRVAVITGGIDTAPDSGYLSFTTASTGTLAERMRIDSQGRVGIGTSTPQLPLDVNGTIQSTGNTWPPPTSGRALVIGYDPGSGGGIQSIDWAHFQSAPAMPLTIVGDPILINCLYRYYPQGNVFIGQDGVPQLFPATLPFPASVYPGGYHVTIGVSQQKALLNLWGHQGGGAVTFSNQWGMTTDDRRLAAIDGLADFSTGDWETGLLTFQTRGAAGMQERMRIDSQGRVGIGTITPQATLDVTGGIRADLPTSSAGLPTGALWNNGGVVNVA